MPWPSVDSPQAAVPHTRAGSSPLPPTHQVCWAGASGEGEKGGLWVPAYLQTTITILQFESRDGASGLCGWTRTLCSAGRGALQVAVLNLTLGEAGGATANPTCSATGSPCHWDHDSPGVRASPKGTHWLQTPACLHCCFYLGWVRYDPEGSVTH